MTPPPDIAVEAAKSAPAITGAIAATLTLNEWVAIATGIYIVLQAAYLSRKWWREEHDWQDKRQKKDDCNGN